MPRIHLAFGVIIAALYSTQAFATNTRTWISGKGVDASGCGPIATPCRTLQYAHDNTSAGGEIDVLDPAGYGSVIISQAISIINDGVGTAGVLATSGDAITISAGAADSVILRGLTVEGAKTASNGIKVNGVGSLTIANCVIQSFTARGIMARLTTSSVIHIFNTTVAGNSDGILLDPTNGSTSLVAVFDRVISTGNAADGLLVAGDGGGTGTMKLSVSNSLFSSNGGRGIDLFSAAMTINAVVTDSVITANFYGLITRGTTTLTAALGRNTISNNPIGVNGTAQSYGNNQFTGNGTDVSGSLTSIALQ